MLKQDEDTICCICLDTYEDPRILSCNHLFCLKCLRETGLKVKKGPGDELPCPICRQFFLIPLEGFNGLTKNSFVERLIEMTHILGSNATRNFCEACYDENEKGEGEDKPTADTYCIECRQKLCEECKKFHQKLKLCKNHRLVPLSEQITDIINYAASIVCELHDQKVLDIYCVECKTVVCAVCFIENHEGHKGFHVNKVADQFRKELENNMEAVSACSSKVQVKKSELVKTNVDFQQKLASLECDIANRKEALKETADKHARSLIEELCSVKRKKSKEIKVEIDELDAYLLTIESYCSHCEKVMTNGSASDICQDVGDLSTRAKELQEQSQLLLQQQFGVFNSNLCFRKSELEVFVEQDGGNMIGEIAAAEEYRSKIVDLEQKLEQEKTEKEHLVEQIAEYQRRITDESRYITEPKRIHNLRVPVDDDNDKCRAISGLAVMGKQLFFTCRCSSSIRVIDLTSKNLCYWKLESLKDPRDLTSCDRNLCLYIIDWTYEGTSNEISRVDTNGKWLKKWSIGSSYQRISVTHESNVLLAVHSEMKLNEYTSDGQLIREIQLNIESEAKHPLHAVSLPNGHFLVSLHAKGEQDHRLYTVDQNGDALRSIGRMEQVDVPICMAFDGNRSFVIADQFKSRVLVYSLNSGFIKELVTMAHGLLDLPLTSVDLDESTGQLFVAFSDEQTDIIQVFSVWN